LPKDQRDFWGISWHEQEKMLGALAVVWLAGWLADFFFWAGVVYWYKETLL
jgi:hypothetical protein